MRRIITLTTDFGYSDWFVGSMKGVIKTLAPSAEIIDVSHDIASGDVWSASFVLAAAVPYFPKGTIHVAVVDPGVGTKRKAIGIRSVRSFFVGPDNGIFTWPLETGPAVQMVELSNPRYFRKEISRTFHGRDIFAPVAAHLARGARLDRMGARLTRIKTLGVAAPRIGSSGVTGEIVHIDRFGNAITNIEASLVEKVSGPPSRSVTVRVGSQAVRGLSVSYGSLGRGKLGVVINSLGLVEVAIPGGNAARRFGLRVGTPVRVAAPRQ